MKKNGFTLIELIGVVVILSLLLLILVPTVSKSLKQGTKDADENTKHSIEMAAKNWASEIENKAKLPCNISLQKLQNEGYIDENIQMPSTGTAITPSTTCVKIERKSGTDSNKTVYTYTYTASCSNTCS